MENGSVSVSLRSSCFLHSFLRLPQRNKDKIWISSYDLHCTKKYIYIHIQYSRLSYILDAVADLRACFVHPVHMYIVDIIQSWNRGGGVEHTLRSGANEWRKPIMKRKDGKHALDPLAR